MGTHIPDTAVHLIMLLILWQRRPNQKAAALAEQLGASVCIMHCYFDMLEKQ